MILQDMLRFSRVFSAVNKLRHTLQAIYLNILNAEKVKHLVTKSLWATHLHFVIVIIYKNCNYLCAENVLQYQMRKKQSPFERQLLTGYQSNNTGKCIIQQ